MNSSLTASLAPQIDELIQQNELLLKENDFLCAFIEQFGDLQLPEECEAPPLSNEDLLVLALYQADCLKEESKAVQGDQLQAVLQLKSLILAFEESLATARRLAFIFQREVLGDTGFTVEANDNEIVHRLPKQVNANAIDSFYSVQTSRLQRNEQLSREKTEQITREVERLQENAQQEQNQDSRTLNQVDFDELKIEHSKLLEKMSIRNQELLRIKLSAGTCLLQMNELKLDLKGILGQKKTLEQDIINKQQKIAELKDKMLKTGKELKVDNQVLEKLKQKEISASDGPYSVDYLSLKVMETTMIKAVEEVQRKISILKRRITNQIKVLEE